MPIQTQTTTTLPPIYQTDFDKILANLKSTRTDILDRYCSDGYSGNHNNLIDINKFLAVLYSLLDINNYLINSEKNEEVEHRLDKFIFTEEFPEITTQSQNIVTYEVLKRTPANLSKNSEPFSGTTHYRPFFIGEFEDDTEGCRVARQGLIYDNRIKITCWSPSTLHARKLASLFENLMHKYYYFLRQFAQVFVYEGRMDGRIDNRHGDTRYQGIPLTYFIRTFERFDLREDEVKNINLNTKVIREIVESD